MKTKYRSRYDKELKLWFIEIKFWFLPVWLYDGGYFANEDDAWNCMVAKVTCKYIKF